MSFNSVPAGKNVPEDIYVIIEMPMYSHSIKYEIKKKTGISYVDRFIPTSMFYPCNYGYINQTMSLDGDPLDVLIPTNFPIQSGSVILCKPIGMLDMTDESGKDIKIIAVPHHHITSLFDNINNIKDLSTILLNKIIHFFTYYKKLEKNKWTKIKCWKNSSEAKKIIIKSLNTK